jgi:hypothetical protein
MTREPAWELVAEFGAGYEADLATSQLEGAGIPVLRKGPETGIFGPGFAGRTALGVRLFVPRSRLEEARTVLQSDPDSPA